MTVVIASLFTAVSLHHLDARLSFPLWCLLVIFSVPLLFGPKKPKNRVPSTPPTHSL